MKIANSPKRLTNNPIWACRFKGGKVIKVSARNETIARMKAHKINNKQRWENLLSEVDYWSKQPFSWE